VSRSGVNDLNIASAVRSFLEATAMSDFRSQADIIAALNSIDIDRATGTDLDKIGFSKGVLRTQASATTGVVTISSNNFVKIATKVYAGAAAPPAGSASVLVSDASAFPSSGAIYIGRGTPNLEGPINYSSITQIGSFYRINLVTNTTKNHNLSEAVVLAQGGNRIINAGAIVQTARNTTSAPITFRVLITSTIPDGEVSLSNIPVVCTQLGSIGNVPAASITEFSSAPFIDATVTNPTAYVTGQDVMTDRDYRQLIKNAEQNRTKGTALAIEAAAVGVSSTDDNKVVSSASITTPANRTEPSILYIDDGSAYQPIFSGQGFEQVIDAANGGEIFLQLQNEDITKALLVSNFQSPFAITGGMKLSIKVGGILSEHLFDDSDFATPNAATVFEVVNSINNDTTLLFSARASDSSTTVTLFANSFVNEDMQATAPTDGSVDANEFMGFADTLTYTLRLYKNDLLLIKDGATPTITSAPQSSWSPISSPQTLTVAVDTTQAATYTFVDADFLPFGYSLLSQQNSLASWAGVITNKLPGITAVVSGNQIVLTSNLGPNNDAAITISGGTLTANGVFTPTYGLASTGRSSDYALNRSTGQVQLATPLQLNDSISAGSQNTRGFTDSSVATSGSITLGSTPTPTIWVVVDYPTDNIVTGVVPGLTISVTNPSGNQWRYTSAVPGVFANVKIDDWAIFDDVNFDANNQGYWRISAMDTSTFSWIEVTRTTGTVQAPNIASLTGLIIVRTDGGLQEITLPSGLQTLSVLAQNINAQLQGGFAEVINATTLRLVSNTFSPTEGRIAVVGINDSSKIIGFVLGYNDASTVSHIAYDESLTSEFTMPDFIFDTVATGTGTIPPTNFTGTTDNSANENPNQLIQFLDPADGFSSNNQLYTQLAAESGTALTIRPDLKLRDIIAGDRYAYGVPYDFDSQDNLVVILDGDSVNKSLNIPLSRNGTVSNSSLPTTTTFTGYDSENGPTANYPASFGNNFSFQDYKIYFKARQVMDPAGANNGMLLSYSSYGPTGNNAQIGIFYPTTPASALQSNVMVSEVTQIQIFLASNPQRLGGNWDNTTQMNVTNTSGNTYRYSWVAGDQPNFVSGAGVQVGDIVNINTTSSFVSNNQGTYIVTAVSDLYFEITNVAGSAEGTVLLNNQTDFVFYPLSPSLNTANFIGAYINNNLSTYVTATQLELGTGNITTSTQDDTGSPYLNLVDGENWISSSNIGTQISPQNKFVLKRPTLLSSSLYSLVGETYYLIPTRAAQVAAFLNIFSVTGLSSLGNITVSDKAGRIQIYSDLFGSSGSVEVSGGSANAVESAVSQAGAQLDTNYTVFGISKNNVGGLHANQWIEIENTATQDKNIQSTSSTTIQIQANTPSVNLATITISAAGSFQTKRTHSGNNTTEMKVEAQGQFVCVSWTGVGTQPNFVGGGLQEGDWVLMNGIFTGLNRGVFKVEKVFGNNAFYILNSNFVKGNYTLANNSDLSFYSYDSVMPGDTVEITGPILGAVNEGSFTVQGNLNTFAQFPSPTQVVVEMSAVSVGPVNLGVNFQQFLVLEKNPYYAYKKIKNLAISPSDANTVNVILYGANLASKINQTAGSNINAISKFGFSNAVESGQDSYKYYGGLIHAVGEVIRGEPTDTVSFPGVAAAGSFIEIDSPLPLFVTLNIVIKTQSGTPFTLLQSRVQSAVAAYVNALGVGAPVVFSDVVTAAGSVDGVQAVAISSPTYNADNEQISTKANEKPVVLNAITNVVVSLAAT
jgi:uncharacterized phage protein gp47/JayE